MTAPQHDTPEAVAHLALGLSLRQHAVELRTEAAAMLRRLHQRTVDAERERAGANALIERMHSQDVLAIKAWQKAHPGNDLLWPSNIRLTAWCMGEIARLTAALATARADALREAAAVARQRVPCSDEREGYMCHRNWFDTAKAIEALIHPTTTGET